MFGQRTGAGAAAHAAAQPADPYLDPVQVREAARDLEAPLERAEGEDPYAIQRDLQATMQRLVGIFRVESDLTEAIGELAELRRRWRSVRVGGGRAYNPGWNLVFELGNLLDGLRGDHARALLRTESRGAHSRLDFPATDDERWGGVNSVVARSADGSMTVATAPLPAMPDALRGLLGGGH